MEQQILDYIDHFNFDEEFILFTEEVIKMKTTQPFFTIIRGKVLRK
jgi:hypothetical protein